MNTNEIKKIESELTNFHGGGMYYRVPHLGAMTEGVKHLIEKAHCNWLVIDCLAYAHALKRKHPNEWLFCFTLTVNKDKESGALKCTGEGEEQDDGTVQDKLYMTRKYDYTDFPLPEIKLWVSPDPEIGCIIFLPSEY
jgi:hypothetical protein